MDISDALVELNVASPEEILDARARQDLYGGDLVENLLDVRSLPEAQVQQAMALAAGIPAARTGELPVASGTAIAAVPRDLATSLCVYPLHENGEILTVVTSRLLDAQAMEQLRRVAGVRRVQLQLALGPRVRQAIARDYGTTLDRRTRKLVARLEGNEIYHSSRAPSSLIDAPPYTELPRPTSIAPSTFLGDWADLETPSHSLLSAETAPLPRAEMRSDMFRSNPPRAELISNPARSDYPAKGERHPDALPLPAPLDPFRRRASAGALRSRDGLTRGPYTLGQAKLDLERATHAEQVLQIYFGFATQYFDVTACFTIQAHKARLRLTRGLSWMRPDARDAPLELADHPTLQAVCESGQWQLARLAATDPNLADRLGFRRPVASLLLPVRVRNRVSLVLLGAFENEDAGLDNAAELLGFEPFVVRALQLAIMHRKTQPEAALSDEARPADGPFDASVPSSLPPVMRRS